MQMNFAACCGGALTVLASLVMTQVEAAWPERPLQMIVAYPAGGSTDSFARAIAKPLSERLGQQVIIQNVPGSSGNIGAARAAKAVADGYTFYFANNTTITINQLVYAALPYDPFTDFVPVASIGTSRAVLVVTPDLPVHSVPELIALARLKPTALNYASSGTGGVSHLAGELFSSKYGIRMTHVPYKGTTPAMVDLLGGQVQVMFSDVAVSHIKNGKLRALAITGLTRSTLVPEVPTFRELGIDGFDTFAWFGVMAPKGVDPAIVQRLSRELTALTSEPQLQAWAESQNGDMMTSDDKQFAVFIKNDFEQWKQVIGQTKVTAD